MLTQDWHCAMISKSHNYLSRQGSSSPFTNEDTELQRVTKTPTFLQLRCAQARMQVDPQAFIYLLYYCKLPPKALLLLQCNCLQRKTETSPRAPLLFGTRSRVCRRTTGTTEIRHPPAVPGRDPRGPGGHVTTRGGRTHLKLGRILEDICQRWHLRVPETDTHDYI